MSKATNRIQQKSCDQAIAERYFSIKPNWTKEFPVNGQGTLIFNIVRNTPFVIVVRVAGHMKWIALVVEKSKVMFVINMSSGEEPLEVARDENIGYENDKMISYWFSYDRDNLTLKYGKGYIMEETTLMTYSFLDKGDDPDAIREKYKEFFNAEQRRQVEQYDCFSYTDMEKRYRKLCFYQHPYQKLTRQVTLTGSKKKRITVDARSLIDIEGKVEFEINPFVHNRSPLVKDSDSLTLNDLDKEMYTFSASLPAACQELYKNVKHCELDDPTESEVKLSDAIRYSINTKGCILHEKLQSKSTEFGEEDIYATYLRVTLGCSFGQSPGIPYVLEIWPSGHYSPIHSHGNACAVIKVLHGGINVKIYNKLTSIRNDEPIRTLKATKGNFTWINRNWFQTHQLYNSTDDFCATIQCYKYEKEDTIHWPYFDYLGDRAEIDEFSPNSDFTFHEMKKKVLEEYGKRN